MIIYQYSWCQQIVDIIFTCGTKTHYTWSTTGHCCARSPAEPPNVIPNAKQRCTYTKKYRLYYRYILPSVHKTDWILLYCCHYCLSVDPSFWAVSATFFGVGGGMTGLMFALYHAFPTRTHTVRYEQLCKDESTWYLAPAALSTRVGKTWTGVLDQHFQSWRLILLVSVREMLPI